MARKKDKSIGLGYPIKRSKDGYFNKTFTSIEELRTNIINVLSTRRGERIMKPDFGSDLYKIIFEQNSQRTERLVEDEVERVIERWVPQVNLTNISINQVKNGNVLLLDVNFTTSFLPEGESESVEMFFSL